MWGWLNAPSELASPENSEPPQEFEITVAFLAAVFSAVVRLVNDDELASTSTILQFGQIADAMSRSSEISCAQPPSARGGVDPPVWLILRKQPLAVVHDGSPNWLR